MYSCIYVFIVQRRKLRFGGGSDKNSLQEVNVVMSDCPSDFDVLGQIYLSAKPLTWKEG